MICCCALLARVLHGLPLILFARAFLTYYCSPCNLDGATIALPNPDRPPYSYAVCKEPPQSSVSVILCAIFGEGQMSTKKAPPPPHLLTPTQTPDFEALKLSSNSNITWTFNPISSIIYIFMILIVHIFISTNLDAYLHGNFDPQQITNDITTLSLGLGKQLGEHNVLETPRRHPTDNRTDPQTPITAPQEKTAPESGMLTPGTSPPAYTPSPPGSHSTGSRVPPTSTTRASLGP